MSYPLAIDLNFRPEYETAVEDELSWRSPFLLRDTASRAPGYGGVYKIYKNKALIYIGKASNLRKRLLQHLWCLTHFGIPAGTTYSVKTARIDNSRSRAAEERRLIDWHRQRNPQLANIQEFEQELWEAYGIPEDEFDREWESEIRRGGRRARASGRGIRRPARLRRPPRRPLRRPPKRPVRPPGRPKKPRRPILIRPRRRIIVRRSEPCICPVHGTEFVRWVQSSLNQILGLRLRVNGVMNRATRNALRDFQKQEGLPVDGIAGPETERALLAVKAERSDGVTRHSN